MFTYKCVTEEVIGPKAAGIALEWLCNALGKHDKTAPVIRSISMTSNPGTMLTTVTISFY